MSDERLTLVARLARALGLDVVTDDWWCGRDHQSGEPFATDDNRPSAFQWPVYRDRLEALEPVPDYLSWDGMGAVIEAMRERGWLIPSMSVDAVCLAEFQQGSIWVKAQGDTLPEAVAMTAIKALEGEQE